MAGQYGVEETLDILHLAEVIFVKLVEKYKNDNKLEIKEVKEIMADPEFQKAVQEAALDASKVLVEVRELDVFDGLILAQKISEMAKRMIGVVKV